MVADIWFIHPILMLWLIAAVVLASMVYGIWWSRQQTMILLHGSGVFADAARQVTLHFTHISDWRLQARCVRVATEHSQSNSWTVSIYRDQLSTADYRWLRAFAVQQQLLQHSHRP